jgi:hypothetical protein
MAVALLNLLVPGLLAAQGVDKDPAKFAKD